MTAATGAEARHAFLAGYSPEVAATEERACELVHEVIPNLVEKVYATGWKVIQLGATAAMNGRFIAVEPASKHVSLLFADGVDLPDPDHLLEGTGKRTRHVKLRSVADAERPAVRALVEAAATQRG